MTQNCSPNATHQEVSKWSLSDVVPSAMWTKVPSKVKNKFGIGLLRSKAPKSVQHWRQTEKSSEFVVNVEPSSNHESVIEDLLARKKEIKKYLKDCLNAPSLYVALHVVANVVPCWMASVIFNPQQGATYVASNVRGLANNPVEFDGLPARQLAAVTPQTGGAGKTNVSLLTTRYFSIYSVSYLKINIPKFYLENISYENIHSIVRQIINFVLYLLTLFLFRYVI